MRNKEIEQLKERFYSVKSPNDLKALANEFFLFIEDTPMREEMICRAYEEFEAEQKEMHKCVPVFAREIEFLKRIDDKTDRRLMYGLLFARKYNYHKSGWIKLDMNEMRYLTRMPKLKSEDLSALIKYRIEMRVIGKRDSTITFMDPDILIYGYTDETYEDDSVGFLTKADCPYKFEDLCCR